MTLETSILKTHTQGIWKACHVRVEEVAGSVVPTDKNPNFMKCCWSRRLESHFTERYHQVASNIAPVRNPHENETTTKI